MNFIIQIFLFYLSIYSILHYLSSLIQQTKKKKLREGQTSLAKDYFVNFFYNDKPIQPHFCETVNCSWPETLSAMRSYGLNTTERNHLCGYADSHQVTKDRKMFIVLLVIIGCLFVLLMIVTVALFILNCRKKTVQFASHRVVFPPERDSFKTINTDE